MSKRLRLVAALLSLSALAFFQTPSIYRPAANDCIDRCSGCRASEIQQAIASGALDAEKGAELLEREEAYFKANCKGRKKNKGNWNLPFLPQLFVVAGGLEIWEMEHPEKGAMVKKQLLKSLPCDATEFLMEDLNDFPVVAALDSEAAQPVHNSIEEWVNLGGHDGFSAERAVPFFYCFIVPDLLGEGFFRVHSADGIQKITSPAAKNLRAELIRKNDSNEQFFWELADAMACDPAFELHLLDVSKKKAVLHGQFRGNPYAVGIKDWDEFLPISNQFLENIGGQAAQRLLFSDGTGRGQKLIDEWFETGQKSWIETVLPIAWAGTGEPLAAVGGAATEIEFWKKLSVALENDPRANWALDTDAPSEPGVEKQFWPFSSPVRLPCSERFGNLFNSKSPQVRLLPLADPGLEIVVEKSDALIFIFKNNANALWAWAWGDDGSLRQSLLIDGQKPFGLRQTGSQSSLIEALRRSASEAEKGFLMRWAEDPSSIRMLDFLEKSSGSAQRVLLFLDEKAPKAEGMAVQRLRSDQADMLPPVVFFEVGDGSLAEKYDLDWKRKIILDGYVFDPANGAEWWFSTSGLAVLNVTGSLDAYLSESCHYLNVPLQKAQRMVDRRISVGGAPSKRVLFEGWLLKNWDRTVWRANPKGLLASTF